VAKVDWGRRETEQSFERADMAFLRSSIYMTLREELKTESCVKFEGKFLVFLLL